jgi:hypothetical protein
MQGWQRVEYAYLRRYPANERARRRPSHPLPVCAVSLMVILALVYPRPLPFLDALQPEYGTDMVACARSLCVPPYRLHCRTTTTARTRGAERFDAFCLISHRTEPPTTVSARGGLRAGAVFEV